MDKYEVWKIISYSWTEIGLSDDEYRASARSANLVPDDLRAIDRIIFKDVCASFAVESFLVFPLFLWTILPDWGFDDEYLRRRAADWYKVPYLLHFFNPLRILGYPVALSLARDGRAKLRSAILENARA